MLQAAARKLVAEGTQEQVGVDRGHDRCMASSLLLLHGFTHTGASWLPVVAALGESYRAIAPDIRGHGSASDAVPVSLEAVLVDLSAVAPEPFTLVGYSMGGRIALHVALAVPDRVHGRRRAHDRGSRLRGGGAYRRCRDRGSGPGRRPPGFADTTYCTTRGRGEDTRGSEEEQHRAAHAVPVLFSYPRK